jgi:bifunctional DNA-binding transcriptional regulator/antitoxin component of YhaV-PrlF toxin-antitoxin module
MPYNGESGRRIFMTKLTITAKGQITLRQELLKHLGVGPVEKIEADKLPDGRILVRAAAQDGIIDDFIGCLSQRDGPKLTTEDINEIATQGWAKAK